MSAALDNEAVTPEEEVQILDSVRKWLARDVKPYARKLEHEDTWPAEMVAQMTELGLFGAIIRRAYGGLGLGASTYAKIVTEVSEVWMSLSGIFNSHLIMASAVQRFGTEAQKQKYLPKFAAGEMRGGLALTEPDCGTDLQAIRTKAVRDGDNYVINGTKTWISNGIRGHCVAMLVKTDTEIQPRHRGLSMFIAEKGPGFTVSRKLEKLGYKGIDSAELIFQDYRVPAANLVGGVEGKGFVHTAGGLELGRINVAARGVGVANAAMKASAGYAQIRKTMGKPIHQHQAIALKLADMATRCEAARLLVEQAAKAYDEGRRCDMEAGMAKLFATEAAMENAAEALRIHGAYGYSKEMDVERYYRDAPLLCIGEGTNEIQRIIIARQLIERESGMSLPLAGIRILAVEHYGAGPFGTVHLADLGAEVIKVEARAAGGDMSRGVGPHFLGEHDTTFYQPYNRNKRSLTLDLKQAQGQAVFHRLVARADAVYNNLRGSQPARLGLTYADLKAHNPRVVCTHVSAYGRSGSRADWPGYDYLLQAECGYVAVTGEPDSPPARMGLSVVDHLTGLTAALGLLAAVVGARASGQGCDVDATLYDTAIHQTTYPAAWYLNHGTETTRLPRSAHPSLAPSQLFPTADGWVFVMCQTQKFWELLCDGVGVPELKTDPRFAAQSGRRDNRAALTEALDAVFRTRGTAAWMQVLAGKVPAAPVLTMAEALENPFLHERGGVQTMAHPEANRLRLLADPIRIDGATLPARAAPKLGADTEAVLRENGFDAAEIAALGRDGVI